jgi:2-methylisocitrate lyase-like PEP mutase family enzyme
MFEGDGETPWLTPKELHRLGFSMILFPTTLLFRVVKTLQGALERLRDGKATTPGKEAVTLKEYEKVLGFGDWAAIEKRYHAEGENG